MTSEILLRLLLASGAACALVLLLRRPLRRLCGAGAAYLLWAAVPASMLAALAPRGGADSTLAVLPLPAPVAAAATQVTQTAASAVRGGWDELLLAAWLAGAMAMALWMAWRQWSFQRGLRAGAWHGGPLLLGVWRARLVLAPTFRRDYDRAERRLVLAHERIHAERGDLLANAACALLQCLAWCNPLIHIAAARFRLDQELSCDETVLRRHGQAGTYAKAMLKTQLAAQGLPLACQWQAVHPLKERIMQLKSSVSPARRLGGKLLAAVLVAGCSLSAMAVHAASAGPRHYNVYLEMDGSRPHLLVKEGEKGGVAIGSGADQWRADFVVLPAGGAIQVKANVSHGGKDLSNFTLEVADNGTGSFKVSDAGKDLIVKMRVSEVH
ncbi:Signal transducer regulating beta-lactamase production, contains metallopeptidase domain [Duganella sp. CF458]|nr:Signal transducer regulating beta-lactamase production, contains metallopeptidase domain [Duganella sp. CF458]